MKKKVKDITDIQIGYQFRGKVEADPNGTYKVVQIRDFEESLNLNLESLSKVAPKGDMTRYIVKKDDVLFLSRGQRNYAIPIRTSLESTIAASYFFILRIKTAVVLPEYLAWYVNQAPAQEYLRNIARRGTHMPLVPLSAFSDLEVELPDLDTQKTIMEISELQEREKQLTKDLQEKRFRLVTSMCLKAARKKEKKG
ncbi:MAG: Type I restriction modification DNA specificity domain protein [Syntrophorhabdus sp. PtaU1.Bin153]|nr:MAG: Type I restriction modification DNA specificity domain protein [Syntrophorhabdus sp. PtaU1.Bin153]